MKKKAILFDLDGTLLPMDQDVFVKYYMKELGTKGIEWGYDPKELVDAVLYGTGFMMKNPGGKRNMDVFWDAFSERFPQRGREKILADIPVFDTFYQNEFNRVKEHCGENPYARPIVEAARRAFDKVILATNPLFPRVSTYSRIGWVGLTPDMFDEVTTYEYYDRCKPSPEYFASILEKHGLRPEECLMIGNDVDEDYYAATAIGIDTMLVTDWLINRHDKPLDGIPTCRACELADILDKMA